MFGEKEYIPGGRSVVSQTKNRILDFGEAARSVRRRLGQTMTNSLTDGAEFNLNGAVGGGIGRQLQNPLYNFPQTSVNYEKPWDKGQPIQARIAENWRKSLYHERSKSRLSIVRPGVLRTSDKNPYGTSNSLLEMQINGANKPHPTSLPFQVGPEEMRKLSNIPLSKMKPIDLERFAADPTMRARIRNLTGLSGVYDTAMRQIKASVADRDGRINGVMATIENRFEAVSDELRQRVEEGFAKKKGVEKAPIQRLDTQRRGLGPSTVIGGGTKLAEGANRDEDDDEFADDPEDDEEEEVAGESLSGEGNLSEEEDEDEQERRFNAETQAASAEQSEDEEERPSGLNEAALNSIARQLVSLVAEQAREDSGSRVKKKRNEPSDATPAKRRSQTRAIGGSGSKPRFAF